MPGQIWTVKEEEFYEDKARMGLSIDRAIDLAKIEGFGDRTAEEVKRFFVFRKKPWNLMVEGAFGDF